MAGRCPLSQTPVGNVVEIFSGIQGEGILVGRRQVFLRLSGCNLRCEYCDTPLSRSPRDYCLVQSGPEGEHSQRAANPLTIEQVTSFVAALTRPNMLQPALTVTGGEPLCQAGFLAALLPELRKLGIETMLETNGALPDELAKLLPHVERVAMDIKLASCMGQPVRYEDNRRFLELSRNHGLFVKMVVCAKTTESELQEALRVVRSVDPGIVVVLQPVTTIPHRGIETPSSAQLLRFERCASEIVKNVRVIPQVHKLLGAR